MMEIAMAPMPVRDVQAGQGFPPLVGNYIYFSFRCLEIWQRLIPFHYGSNYYDDCARCYARLAKLMLSVGSQIEIPAPLQSSEVVCNWMFHLATDRPKVAAELMAEVLDTFYDQQAVIDWARQPENEASSHAGLVLRFSELAEIFSRQVFGLWRERSDAATAASHAREFAEELARIYAREISSNLR